MTVITHSALPTFLLSFLTKNPLWLHLAAITGGGPDYLTMINGYYGWVSRLYNKLHRPWLWKGTKWYWIGLALGVLLPPWGLHLLMDYRYHDNDDHSRHMVEMVRVECVLWIGMLWVIMARRNFIMTDFFGGVIITLTFLLGLMFIFAEKIPRLKQAFLDFMDRLFN